jgi:glucuronosyltransferase
MASCLVFFFISAVLIAGIFSARILSVFPTPSKSHWILAQPLMKALVKAGHEVNNNKCVLYNSIYNKFKFFKVTVISPFPLENPPVNYTDIELTGLTEFFEGQHLFILEKVHF